VTRHHRDTQPSPRWVLPSICSAITVLALVVVCTSVGLIKLIGGVILLGVFASVLWIAQKSRFVAIAPAIGLILTSLVIIGFALAAVHALDVRPVALTVGTVAVAAVWASSRRPSVQRAPLRPLHLIAAGGAAVFAMAAVFAIHYSSVSAVTDLDQATSLAVWAYPSGHQLHVGVQQPPEHQPISLRIVVIHAGLTAAVWNHVRLAPGQTWQAPPLTLAGSGPIRVIARDSAQVVASLSVVWGPTKSSGGSGVIQKRRRANRRHHDTQRHGFGTAG
jgi:hypothetical protein